MKRRDQRAQTTKGETAAPAPAMPIILHDSAKQLSASVLSKATSVTIPAVGALREVKPKRIQAAVEGGG